MMNIFDSIMMKRVYLLAAAALLISLCIFSSCKSGTKTGETQAPHADTTKVVQAPNVINLPHADTALIPELSKLLDNAFDASAKKDYAKLGALIIYRGPNQKRYGTDVFDTKNVYDKNVVRITSDVFNKWNKNVDSRDYSRIFSLDQPDGSKMPVLEVIFVTKKSVDRRFFGFLKLKESYKIVDVTSNL